jgi:CHAD domain-containing protein
MAYELSKNEIISENIRRIWTEELSAAIRRLENISAGNEREKDIHEVRKGIKKIRAVLRLVRKSMGAQLFKQENIRYRNLGHMLSHVRDATVMIKTLDKLKTSENKAISTAVYNRARKDLQAKQAEVSRIFFEENNSIADVLAAFKDAQQHQPEIPVAKDSFTVFATNIKQIYTQGKKAYAYARKKPGIESFHELRKEVKNLWYHTRILSPLWPAYLEAYAKELGILAEQLGDDHDLGVLFEEIESGRLAFARKATSAKLLALIEDQRHKLQQQVHPLAKRIFAEDAESYTDRLILYWKIWRKEKEEPQTQSA